MMSGEAILGIVLKETFQRPRPQSFFGFVPPDSYSFPSGHAFASLCFFGTLAWLISKHQSGKLPIFLIWTAAVFFILTIGSSRIYLGVHYPSDILAGYLAGITWLVAIYLADHRLQPANRPEADAP
jgi:undecaprenyl-diphosphatase